ncbi:MAG: hypothetical protein KatS3mg087_1486 [Patescibacteria group bacterium]|nr:MAG: hypothetical protein KatS3mg087_1486 [Patescibacteria group bacterium]
MHKIKVKVLSAAAKNARILSVDKVKNFLNSSYEEMKRVTWPSRKDAIRLTGYVIGVSFGVGLFVMLLDYIFAELLALMLTK